MLALRARAAAPGVLSCQLRATPLALARGLTRGRGFCTGGPKAPSGFGNFYPKGGATSGHASKRAAGSSAKESVKPDKGGEKLNASSAESSGSKASTGGGGGGSGPEPSQQMASMAVAALGASVITWALTSGDSNGGRTAQQISMQHFLSNLLAAGRVRKLLVVNGSTVKVFVTEDMGGGISSDPDSQPWQDGGRTSGSRLGTGAGTGALVQGSDGGGAAYYFSIGSIEQLEEKIEAAQAQLGVKPRDFIPVQFVTETSMLSEAGRFLPTLLLIGFFYALSRGMSGGMGGMGGMGGPGGIFNVGKSKAVKASKVPTRFADVAGLKEAKVEVMEFVDILQNPERYTRLGAKIPKGALLVGPPGCGKTLLAKATAGESKAPFYSMSGSDFIEMFVGVGPSRVRDLFKTARENAPCLIFIDEIDAIGKQRGKGGFNGGNDERENTLNQLLIELDGFSPSSGIVVLAGTNRQDVLDKALLRPGRFDRQIVIDKPDILGRTEIFGVHLKTLKLEDDAEGIARKLAALTPGFSGAECANVCNEAALIAARFGRAAVGRESFDAAIDRVIAGLEKKDLTIDPHERRVVAFHEAGHALTGWVLEHADPVMKVSIVPRGKAALGYSQSLPRDVSLHTEDQLSDTMCMALGGRAAEDVVFNIVSTGAQNDMERVTNMAHQQVAVFGMSEAVGPLSFESGENSLYKPYSEKTAQLIDSEVNAIVSASYTRALELLRVHEAKLHALAECLLEKEVVGSEDLVRILGPRHSKSKEYMEFIDVSWGDVPSEKLRQGKEGEAEAASDGSEPTDDTKGGTDAGTVAAPA